MNWEQIYTEFRPALIEVAARCERADRDAADIVNEVFAAMLGDPPAGVFDWLAFLTGLVAEIGAAESDLPRTTSIDDGQVELGSTEDAAAIAVRRLTACEARQRVLGVMVYMTERQRQVTRLRLFDGLSVGEIAALMNTSSSNISQIVIRCLAKLQPVLTTFDTFGRHDLEEIRPPRRAFH